MKECNCTECICESKVECSSSCGSNNQCDCCK